MKIVLDTNCLIKAVPPKSDCHYLLSALQQGCYILCVSTEILLEYEEILTRFYGSAITENVLGFIIHSPNTEFVDAHFHWHLIYRDYDDNKFADCAVNGNAENLIATLPVIAANAAIPRLTLFRGLRVKPAMTEQFWRFENNVVYLQHQNFKNEP